jgi:plastocyanin
MTTKSLISMAVLTVTICTCGQQSGNAVTPPSSANSPTGTATLTGVVRFEGQPPKPKTINMAADPKCAKLHPSPVLLKDVLTDPQGGLQDAVIFVADGLSETTKEPPNQPVVIEQKGCMYEPHVLAMRTDQRLQIVNHDPTSHNVHPTPANNREWNKAQPPGSKAEETFSREEIAVPVKCNIHPWMKGYVAVFKHPYFAVTPKDGTFELRNLPPGTYTIRAWHEQLGSSTQKVTVAANERKVINFVFRAQPGT